MMGAVRLRTYTLLLAGVFCVCLLLLVRYSFIEGENQNLRRKSGKGMMTQNDVQLMLDKALGGGRNRLPNIADVGYFSSYANYRIHQMMLGDSTRTGTYRDAIYDNKHLFKGKVVLDIGCGTGILSMFAAKAGAAKVIGIDASDIIDQAKKIVRKNNLENVITLIKGKVEEISLPAGVDKVDIIVSEWMGHFLLFESMLQTVLFARDNWLVPDGLILPDRAILYISAFNDRNLDWWDKVYDFDMSPMRDHVMSKAHIAFAPKDDVACGSSVLKDIDLYTVKAKDLDFETSFSLTCPQPSQVNSLVAYFDVDFSKCDKKHRLSTSPQSNLTHWQHAVFNLIGVEFEARQGDVIKGTMKVNANQIRPRSLDVTVDVEFKGRLSQKRASQSYFLF